MSSEYEKFYDKIKEQPCAASGYYILARMLPPPQERKSEGGILIATGAGAPLKADDCHLGVVLSVGSEVEIDVKVSDIVALPSHAGTEYVRHKGERVAILQPTSVVGVYDTKELGIEIDYRDLGKKEAEEYRQREKANYGI